ncbi:hypothetical protein V8F20_011620 [Naviculisporaceae sp. PSN 640]
MASYRVINRAIWASPEPSLYDDTDYTQGDDYSSSYSAPHYIRHSSVGVHRQPPQQDYHSDERRVEYTGKDRYGSSYRSNDPASFPPELSSSPSISSGSTIRTPSIRSYQNPTGSYFPPAIKGHETRYEETRLEYSSQFQADDGVRHTGGLFSSLKLDDTYSGRMDAGLYDNPERTYVSKDYVSSDYARRNGEEPTRYEVDDAFDETKANIHTQSRRHSIKSKSQIKQLQPQDWLPTPSTEKTEEELKFEVDDIFDEAEETVTADDWTMESSLVPGITSCGRQAVKVLRESEAINKDLKSVAAALAEFRAKRKQRPSFAGRSNSSSSKFKSSSNVFYTVRHRADDWDRHHREKRKYR